MTNGISKKKGGALFMSSNVVPIPGPILATTKGGKLTVASNVMPIAPTINRDPLTGDVILGGPSIIAPNILTYQNPLTTPPNMIRKLSNPNMDPLLQKHVIKYYYQRLKEIYLPGTFSKLLKYVTIKDNNLTLVSSYEEYKNNNSNERIHDRVKFILHNYFSKYDLELVLVKAVEKYSLNWYELKNRHSSLIKKKIYKKIKERLERKSHI